MNEPQFQPVRPADPETLSGRFDAFDKLDGWRLLVRRGEALLRNGRNVWDRLSTHVRERVSDTWLDGELLVPGEPATAVQAALATRDDRLSFRPFHLLGSSLDARDEHAELIRMGWEPPRYFGRFTARQVRNRWPAWSQTVTEGIVLHPVNGGDWLKLKRTRTIDLPVVGLIPGRGRLAGMVGALACRLPNGRTANIGSGLTDDDRRQITPDDIGRVAEIAYQGRTPHGLLRHARFVRWRDDLPRHTTSGAQLTFA